VADRPPRPPPTAVPAAPAPAVTEPWRSCGSHVVAPRGGTA